jgi:RimJ/RimL family protein N-acetyltransferase
MPPELATERLRLRLRDGRDAEWNLQLIAEDPSRDALPLDQERERLDAQRHVAEEVGFGLYTIEVAETGEAVGYCGLVLGRASPAQPELAYELLRRHVGSGYATEAAAVVADAAFDCGFPVLWATVERWNAPSFRVLEKLGFAPARVSGEGDKVLVWMYRKAPRRRHRARG